MRLRNVAALFVVSAALLACSSVRETKALAYPGDAAVTTEPIAAVLIQRGYQPVCKTGEYCKFTYNDRITIHFKIRPHQVVLAVDVANGKELPPAEVQKFVNEGMKVGEEIFNAARPGAAKIEQDALVAEREEEARRAKERAQREEEARRARELAAAQAAAQPQAGTAGTTTETQPPPTPVAQPLPNAVAPVEIAANITYTDDFGRTAFIFKEPERTVCEIVGDNVWAGSKTLEIPFRHEAIGGTYYTFECKLPSGAVWRKKIEAKKASVTTVRLVIGGTGGTGGSSSAPSGGLPAPTAPTQMTVSAFATVKAAVEKEAFSDGKLRVIQMAASANWMSAAQVGELVDLISQSSDKVKVVELTSRKIVDRQNAHTLLSHFTFSDDKAKVQKLLGM